MAKVCVVGTTSWGIALATMLAHRQHSVYLCARTEEEAVRLGSSRHSKILDSMTTFPQNLRVTACKNEAFHGVDLVIIAVPSRSFRENIREICSYLEDSVIVVSATKGLELNTGKRMSQIMETELPSFLNSNACVMSGPNLASEIIQDKPSSTVVASKDITVAQQVQTIINSTMFRVYINDDIVGVEYGGALKNIIALGAGICDGLKYGDNAKSAFITRGLAEITRLGITAGANPITFLGLSGIGDLITTCSSRLSRNHYVGEQLATGKKLGEIRSDMKHVAEGIDTTYATVHLSKTLEVDMPITRNIYSVLFEGLSVKSAVEKLLSRVAGQE